MSNTIHTAAKHVTEHSTLPQLDPPFSGIGESSRVMMATDGGNDTEQEEDGVSAEKPKKTNKSSPKKRTAGNTGEEDSSPKKKRAAAKGKVAIPTPNAAKKPTSGDKPGRDTVADSVEAIAAVAVKSENDTAEGQAGSTERPSTPEAQTVKEANTPKTPKTPRSSGNENIVEANDATPKQARAKTHSAKPKANPKQSPVKGKRAGAEKVADKVVLPTKWSEASEADKMLVRMKEAGRPWSEIRVKWYEMTGQDTAPSTLPNRYKRLQVIMMELQDGEKEVLLSVKAHIESNWKTSLWGLVSSKMEEQGTRKYPADFLAKEFRKLEAAGDTDVSPATIGAYAPTAPVTPKGKSSAATNGHVKAEDTEAEAEEGGDVLFAAAAEAMEGESETGAEEVAAVEEAAE